MDDRASESWIFRAALGPTQARTALCPGFTRSEFHDVMGTRQAVDGLPGFMWMDARKVARQGYAAALRPKMTREGL